MKLIFLYIVLFISFSYSLTESQLEKIKSKTESLNLAPDFTLYTIKSKDFSEIKKNIILIAQANEQFILEKNRYSNSIDELILSNALTISNDNIKNWSIILSKGNIDIVAKHLDYDIELIYHIKEDIFSILTPDENSLISEDTVTLSDLRGKVVLINFWATWCGPCRLEIPDFNDLYKKYNEKGLEILAISISDSKDQLKKFKNAYNIFYPILYGKQSIMSKIQMEYGGIYSIPVSFLVDKSGEIIRGYPGAILKQFNPSMYTDLITNIENALLK